MSEGKRNPGNYSPVTEFQLRYIGLYLKHTNISYVSKRLLISLSTVKYSNEKYFKIKTTKRQKQHDYYSYDIPDLLNKFRALKNNYKKFPSFRESAIYKLDEMKIILDKYHGVVPATWRVKENRDFVLKQF